MASMNDFSFELVRRVLSHLHGYNISILLLRVCSEWRQATRSLRQFRRHVYAWTNGRPMLVDTLSGTDIVQVACSTRMALARSADGRVWQWRLQQRFLSSPRLIRSLKNIQSIAITPPCYDIQEDYEIHMGAVDADGGLWMWGSNELGQLGLTAGCDPDSDGASSDECCDSDDSWETVDSEEQAQLESLQQNPRSEWIQHPQRTSHACPVLQMACGCGFSVLLVQKPSGPAVQCYGCFPPGNAAVFDNYGGLEQIEECVPELEGKDVVQVACGGYWIAALCRSGDLYTWGSTQQAGTQGDYLGLGNAQQQSTVTAPQLLQTLEGQVAQVCCGDIMMGAITRDGKLWTWGDGDNSSLGHGDAGQHVHTPKLVEDFEGQAAQLAFSFGNSALVDSHKELYLWGTRDRLVLHKWLSVHADLVLLLPGVEYNARIGRGSPNSVPFF